ncbi:glycosyltransferase [Streptomyces sp. ISL-22]|uniref:glycosyltransferase n=1 Tax=unclassified Streptomyces TaxID=2593676 RepID=UPI001BEA0151|nr:glycosyltransferase [Streptomyces sp. ISL-24]MBT2434388.1 glycosyltransferase [Streptomyces sp. ISL-22]
MEVEGLGIVFLEASAAGLPIIVGDSGGAPDTVRDGETGFLVDGHDVRALADRLTVLLHDTSLAHEMGRRGRDRVREEWGWEQGYGQPAALLGVR